MQKCYASLHFGFKAYYNKKANASKLEEADYIFVLQSKADNQGSKTLFTKFRWIGFHIIEKMLPNNNYLVRKIGTNKTQLLHCMRMHQFTHRQTPLDIRITQQLWKPDLEMRLKHDDLYARAWEGEYEKPIFDAKTDNATPPNLLEIPLQSHLATDETWNTPGTRREGSLEIFPQTEELFVVTGTYPYMEHVVEISSEQPNNGPTNTWISK